MTIEEKLKTFQAKPENEAGSVESQKMDFLARQYMAEHQDVSYRDAGIAVSKMIAQETK